MRVSTSPTSTRERYQKIKQLLLEGLDSTQIASRLGVSFSSISYAKGVDFQIKTCLHTPYCLTTIEFETIKLAGMGYSNHAIALLCKSAYRAVDSRLMRVYRKLGITNNEYICKRNTAINMLSEFLIDR